MESNLVQLVLTSGHPPPSMNERVTVIVMPKEHCVGFTLDLCWLFVKLQTLFLRAPLDARLRATLKDWEYERPRGLDFLASTRPELVL
jgi:hypothetical protein